VETFAQLRRLIELFKIGRRDPRFSAALPETLAGTDGSDRIADQRVTTINISRRGALLKGIRGKLRSGDKISLARLHKKEHFRVAWVGEQDTPEAGQVGVAPVDVNSSFWDDALEAKAQPEIQLAHAKAAGT
jgi:hypothetical protein